MALTWDNVRTDHDTKAPRLLIHAQPGVGKSTFGACAPSPIFICTEDGLGRSPALRDVPAFKTSTPQEVIEALDLIIADRRTFKTIVVDSVDHLQDEVAKMIAHANGKETIEEIAYGKGWLLVRDWFATQYNPRIQWLQNNGMLIVEIAHSSIVTENSPDLTMQFKRWVPALSKHVLPIFFDCVDMIGYGAINVTLAADDSGFNKGSGKVKATGAGDRRLYCQPGGGYLAKTRWPLPEYLPLDFGKLAPLLTGMPV